MSSNFVPSPYQSAIFEWVSTGSGNAIINAVAGSGKTTTLVESCNVIPSRNLFFSSFNNHIVETLKKRLPAWAECRTIHSIGNRCLRRHLGNEKLHPPKKGKYTAYCTAAAKSISERLQIQFDNKLSIWLSNGAKDADYPDDPPSLAAISRQIEDLVNLTRCTLADVESIDSMSDMVEHFSIDCPIDLENILYVIKNILDNGEAVAISSRVIDFTDMIWLPYKWNLTPPSYDWILIDEAQDLNAAQLHLIKKMKNEHTRFIFVGDPNQAIYGFSGADSDSFERIKEEVSAMEFPLSICYRCPGSVIDIAKTMVPQIEGRPSCEDGEVIEFTEDKIFEHIQEQDLILCRSTEPLVRLCFKLLAQRKNARIKGRDIGKSLVTIVSDVQRRQGFSYEQFEDYLRQYFNERVAKLQVKTDYESQVIDFADQVASVAACYDAFNCSTVNEFKAELERLFSDDTSAITLSTIHRTKGLEENRVFILHYERLPLKWDKQKEWQFQQETNLKYVAVTRAKKSLYLVKRLQDDDSESKHSVIFSSGLI